MSGSEKMYRKRKRGKWALTRLGAVAVILSDTLTNEVVG